MNKNDQLILNFNINKSYLKEDYFVSESKLFSYTLVEYWPKWEKNIINICGEKFSGKSHLSQIFYSKSKCKFFDAKNFNYHEEDKLRYYENIILDNFDKGVDEKSIYSLFNFVDQNNKFLLINSIKPINEIEFEINDLKSRLKNCIVAKIDKPDDKLLQVQMELVLKSK